MAGITEEMDLDKPTALDPAAAAPVPGLAETPGGVQMQINTSDPTPAQLAEPTQVVKEFQKLIPDAYKDAPWIKELEKTENPQQELFKKVANLQELAGRKGEGLKIPGEGASPEEQAIFRKALGVPEKASDYVYEAPKAPQGLEKFYNVDEKFMNSMKEAALKAGVTPGGFKEFATAYNGFMDQSIKDSLAQQQQYAQKVQEDFAKKFGDKVNKVRGYFEQSVNQLPDGSSKAYLEQLGPEARTAMADWAYNFANKYISEDKLDIKDGVVGQAHGELSEKEYGDAFGKIYAIQRKFGPISEGIQAVQDLEKLRARGMAKK